MEPITITLPGWNQISSYFFPPESTDDVIIFPYSSGSRKFHRTVDPTKLTQGKASWEDIHDVLTIFELVFGRVSSTPRFLAGIFFPFLIPFLIFTQFFWAHWKVVRLINTGFLAFAFIFGTYCLYKRMCETGRRKVDMQRMMEMIRPVYAKRGLAWHFSENFFCSWLELKKESSTDEQNISLSSIEVHSGNNQESFISQCRIFEDFKDGENIIVCAGKNLTGADFKHPLQFRYVICFIIYGYIMVSWISTASSSYYYYYRYYY